MKTQPIAIAALALMLASELFGVDTQVITQVAKKVHSDFRSRTLVKKIPVSQALLEQKTVLQRNPAVTSVTQLKGANLLVRFKDGRQLLMLLGEDRLGSPGSETLLAADTVMPLKSPTLQKAPQLQPVIQKPPLFLIKPCAPTSRKALVFDALADDANVINPPINQQVKANLEALGYSVTLRNSDNANLANAALIDNGEYGVVFMRGHGGVVGSDFAFLVRPWFDAWPPASGYAGTLVASAHNNAVGEAQFGYAITGAFSAAYWTEKAFPGTMFFLESCHGADPGGLPGMPQWTVDHGSSVWLGWNESVSFNCGDNGSDLFFDRMQLQQNVGAAVSAVYDTGCRPPELVTFPENKNACRLPLWKSDSNEASVPNARDFKLLKLLPYQGKLWVEIEFYTTPSFDEFFLYANIDSDEGAELQVKCRPDSVAAYTETSPGAHTNLVYSGKASVTGRKYAFVIPWNTTLGSGSWGRIWLYDMGGKDRLPDSGNILIRQ